MKKVSRIMRIVVVVILGTLAGRMVQDYLRGTPGDGVKPRNWHDYRLTQTRKR